MLGRYRRFHFFYFLIAICVVLVIGILWRIEMIGPMGLGQVKLWDFDVYYQLARDSWRGINPYTVSYMQTLGPPLVIAPFLIFAWMPITLARSVFLWVNIVCWLLSCVVLSRLFSEKRFTRWLITGGLFFGLLLGFPARFTLNVGQPLGLVTLALTLLLTTQRPVIKGTSLALMIFLKTFFVFPILALMKHEKQTLSWCILGLVVMVIGLFPVIRPVAYQTFIKDRLVTTTLQKNQARDVDYYNQSLKATLQRIELSQWYLPVFLMLVGISVLVVYKSESVLLGVLTSVLLSPVVWQHYFSILLPVIVFLYRDFTPSWKRKVLLLLGVILTNIEFPWLHGKPLTMGYGILASHFFWGLLIMIGLVLYHEVYSLHAKPKS